MSDVRHPVPFPHLVVRFVLPRPNPAGPRFGISPCSPPPALSHRPSRVVRTLGTRRRRPCIGWIAGGRGNLVVVGVRRGGRSATMQRWRGRRRFEHLYEDSLRYVVLCITFEECS